MNAPGEMQELEFAIRAADGGVGGDQLADAGTVDIIDVARDRAGSCGGPADQVRTILRSIALPSPSVILPLKSIMATSPISRHVP